MHDTKKRLFDSIECLALQIYEGEVEPWLMSDYCTDTVPVLLRRATFCRAFAADAKDFRSYNSWVGSPYHSHCLQSPRCYLCCD